MHRNAPTTASWPQVASIFSIIVHSSWKHKSEPRREMEALRSENFHIKQVIF
jgi:hypothetical protein